MSHARSTPTGPEAVGLAVCKILNPDHVLPGLEFDRSFFELGAMEAVVLDDYLPVNQQAPQSLLGPVSGPEPHHGFGLRADSALFRLQVKGGSDIREGSFPTASLAPSQTFFSCNPPRKIKI